MKEKKSRVEDKDKNKHKDSGAVPNSDGLLDSQSHSIGEQLSGSCEKMIFILSLSVFLNIIIGPTLYKIDVYSQNFSEVLMNIPPAHEKDACKQYFDNEFNKVIQECKNLKNKEQCMEKLRNVEVIGEACFKFKSESTGDNQGGRKDAEETTEL